MRLHSILAPKQKRVVEKGAGSGLGLAPPTGPARHSKHQAFPDHPRPPPVLKRASVQPRPGQETSTADLTYGYSTVCQKCAGAGAGTVLMECPDPGPPSLRINTACIGGAWPRTTGQRCSRRKGSMEKTLTHEENQKEGEESESETATERPEEKRKGCVPNGLSLFPAGQQTEGRRGEERGWEFPNFPVAADGNSGPSNQNHAIFSRHTAMPS